MGEKLVSLYLDGSLVVGDFNKDISDIDLVAVISSEINKSEFRALKKMHADFVGRHPSWYDRIEVCYITIEALKHPQLSGYPIVNISPGEPIHKIKTKKEWLMNWYLTREKALALFGPPIKEIIVPISKNEFIESVKDHIRSWEKWLGSMRERRGQVAYAVLSLCRALYAVKNRDQASKLKACRWVATNFPAWAGLIKKAKSWRASKMGSVDDTTYQEVVQFLKFVQKETL